VINLSADKGPGTQGYISACESRAAGWLFRTWSRAAKMLPELRERVLLSVGCIAGPFEQNDYRSKLSAAGFENVDLEPRVYTASRMPVPS
jgi:hypothetical protein